MKVLLINTYDYGGAANACIRLHEALLDRGINSKLLLLHKKGNVDKSYQFDHSLRVKKSFLEIVLNKLFQIQRRIGINLINEKKSPESIYKDLRSKRLEYYSSPHSLYDITKSKLFKEADVINLHWVAGFLDYKTFFETVNKPLIWTLHDMSPFLGGEHYSEFYTCINDKGFPEARTITKLEENVFNNNISFKLNCIHKNLNLSIVSPSKWLLDESKSSLVLGCFNHFHIPYGLSVNLPNEDSEKLKINFGIPTDKKIILFVADSLENERKGFKLLQIAINELVNNELFLISVGNIQSQSITSTSRKDFGFVRDQKMMMNIFQLADAFVIPSLMDNLPNTVLESLVCGTPVLGFNIGGIPDMIEHGLNGLLSNELSSTGLMDIIDSFIKKGVELDRCQIRRDAVLRYNASIQADRYINLFEEIR